MLRLLLAASRNLPRLTVTTLGAVSSNKPSAPRVTPKPLRPRPPKLAAWRGNRREFVRRFKDGSRLVRVPVRKKGRPREIVEWLELREIRVQLHRKGHRSTELRLWTTLLDPKLAPASELVELYAKRWEHELYFREVKHSLRRTDLLQSHTVTTAAQDDGGPHR